MLFNIFSFLLKRQISKRNPLLNFEDILENHLTLSIIERNEFYNTNRSYRFNTKDMI